MVERNSIQIELLKLNSVFKRTQFSSQFYITFFSTKMRFLNSRTSLISNPLSVLSPLYLVLVWLLIPEFGSKFEKPEGKARYTSIGFWFQAFVIKSILNCYSVCFLKFFTR